MAATDAYRPMRGLNSYAKRAALARPGDYLIAICSAPASMPFIGRHLEPIGGLAALGVWAGRHLAGFLVGDKVRYPPVLKETRREECAQTAPCLRGALQGVVPADKLDAAWPVPGHRAPFLSASAQRRYVYRASIPYGENPNQVLDVWRREDLPKAPAPVLIFIPGGAWVFGSRLLQGHELMARLARIGWVCLSVQYRTSPHHRWPRQMTDVKAAIAWARGNVGQFGGDQNFITVAGCSAGGHLATLAGLTPNDPAWQQGLPGNADTSVDAVVSVYGRYDWQDRSTLERARFVEFLERIVVKRPQAKYPQVFHQASPVARVSAAAPPFLAIHGSRDRIIPVEEAREFVKCLNEISTDTVCYAELPGAGHGFDLLDAARTGPVVHAIGLFLDHVYHRPKKPVDEAI